MFEYVTLFGRYFAIQFDYLLIVYLTIAINVRSPTGRGRTVLFSPHAHFDLLPWRKFNADSEFNPCLANPALHQALKIIKSVSEAWWLS